jgi:hypothetical protein
MVFGNLPLFCTINVYCTINATNKMLIADGAMDVVVSNWTNGYVVPENENLTIPLSLSIC